MAQLDEVAGLVDEEFTFTREEMMTARSADSAAHDIEAIYRMWGWLRHWGHETPDLGGLEHLPLGELRALMKRETVRVQVLARRWEQWW